MRFSHLLVVSLFVAACPRSEPAGGGGADGGATGGMGGPAAFDAASSGEKDAPPTSGTTPDAATLTNGLIGSCVFDSTLCVNYYGAPVSLEALADKVNCEDQRHAWKAGVACPPGAIGQCQIETSATVLYYPPNTVENARYQCQMGGSHGVFTALGGATDGGTSADAASVLDSNSSDSPARDAGDAGDATGMGGTGGAAFVNVKPCSSESDYKSGTSTITATAILKYSPNCLKIKTATAVKFSVDFALHPLRPSARRGDTANNPIRATDTGSEATFTFDKPGFFGYFCNYHGSNDDGAGMEGVIWVTD